MWLQPEHKKRTANENTAVPGEEAAASVQYGQFEEIFRQTKDRLYHFTLKLTQNSDDAKDIIQECYTRLWEKLPGIDTHEAVLPLLLTYARHCFIDRLRRRERDTRFLAGLSNTLEAAETASAEASLELNDTTRQLHALLDQLPAKRRQIFTLVKEDGLTHKEVADQLGIAAGTVEKQVTLSLRFLRKGLNT